jgi:hypothetical protein
LSNRPTFEISGLSRLFVALPGVWGLIMKQLGFGAIEMGSDFFQQIFDLKKNGVTNQSFIGNGIRLFPKY